MFRRGVFFCTAPDIFISIYYIDNYAALAALDRSEKMNYNCLDILKWTEAQLKYTQDVSLREATAQERGSFTEPGIMPMMLCPMCPCPAKKCLL